MRSPPTAILLERGSGLPSRPRSFPWPTWFELNGRPCGGRFVGCRAANGGRVRGGNAASAPDGREPPRQSRGARCSGTRCRIIAAQRASKASLPTWARRAPSRRAHRRMPERVPPNDRRRPVSSKRAVCKAARLANDTEASAAADLARLWSRSGDDRSRDRDPERSGARVQTAGWFRTDAAGKGGEVGR